MQIRATLIERFVFLYSYSVGISIGVVSYSGHLPGHLHARASAGDLECVFAYLLPDIYRRKSAYAGKLVAKILVERPKPIRHRNNRLSVFVEYRNSIVDVFHIGRFNERVVKVLVGRIEGMIDLEGTAAFGQVAGDGGIADDVKLCSRSRGSDADAGIVAEDHGIALSHGSVGSDGGGISDSGGSVGIEA